jgi:hypothetical protein
MININSELGIRNLELGTRNPKPCSFAIKFIFRDERFIICDE